MTIELKVPSIACEVCVETITREIQSHEPEALVEVDLTTKIVKIETKASEASIRQMIAAAGHEVA